MAKLDDSIRRWTNPSTKTLAERKKFAGLVDDFATFIWDNTDMFNEFGAFIINDKKGSLKFYNGASFKNEYSKPQFQNGYTNLSGISFDTQKISFQVGIYWISIEDYRILINFLHPYKIAYLAFSFEKEYGYYCKLAEIKDSTRYVVGKETSSSSDAAATGNLNYSQLSGSNQSGYRYYTELTLTFEVIGAQCAKQLDQYYTNGRSLVDGQINLLQSVDAQLIISDLENPIQINFDNLESNYNTFSIRVIAQIEYNNAEHRLINNTQLLNISFKNVKDKIFNFTYDSEQGIVYWRNGEKEQILSLLSTNDTGERIISSLDSKQFYWPGVLEHKELKNEGTTLYLFIDTSTEETPQSGISILDNGRATYTSRKRTNVL